MMYSKLLELINQITALETNEFDLIKSSFSPILLNKCDFFLEACKIDEHICSNK